MKSHQTESEILAEYEQKLAHYNLSKERILEIRQSVIRIADQIMDHYFDHLNDS
jgi:hypothetical protein